MVTSLILVQMIVVRAHAGKPKTRRYAGLFSIKSLELYQLIIPPFYISDTIAYIFMQDIFQPEKTLWTEIDFDVMSWHDCPIYALSFDKDDKLFLDIDYIFKWVLMKNKRRFKFWISPCTLVFENVYDIVFESHHTTIIIDNISRENPRRPKNAEYINKELEYDWIIETIVGEISFKSVGFKQYVRQAPVLISTQELDLETRNGISFNRISFT